MSVTAAELNDAPIKEVELNSQTLRDDLISTAVKFLQNPRVSARPNSEKEKFLRGKGLNDAEISAAFKVSGTNSTQQDNSLGHFSSVKVAQVHGYSSAVVPAPSSRWAIVRDILNATVLLAGAAYSLRYLFKRFIAPLLFGRRKKEKSLADTVSEMNANLTKLVGEISTAVKNLSDSVATLHSKQTEKVDVAMLKTEIASLKALMLSRRQFPATPTVGATIPTIPAWQLASDNEKRDLQMEMLSSDILNQHNNASTPLSSSPEIISVEEMPNANVMPIQLNVDLNPIRDSSESSETGSAEIVEMGTGEDTD